MNPRGRRYVALVLGLIILALVGSAGNTAAAGSGPVQAVLLTSTPAVYVGLAVDVTVHVFESGIHIDATSLTVSIPGSRSLTATHTTTGVYDVAFTVQTADVRQDCGLTGVCVTANATVGAYWDVEMVILTLAPYAVNLTTSATHVSAGQAVNVTAFVTNNGTAVDPDTMTLYSSLYSPAGPDVQQTLVATHPSTGTYKATVVIPTSFKGTGIMYLNGNAVFSGISIFGQTDVGVGQPTGPWVWSRLVSVGAATAAVDLYVTNDTGWPAAAAAVSGSNTFYSTTTVTNNFTATTDANGIARANLNYPGARFGTRYRGSVTVGGTVVGFSGYVDPRSTDLVVILDPTTITFSPGSAASVTGTIYANGTALAGQALSYVVYTTGAIVASGQTSTDASAKASVSFLMPSSTTFIAYTADVSGTWYSGAIAVYSRPLTATHNTVHAGSVLEVSIPALPATVRSVSVTFQALSTGVNYDPSWTLASGSSGSVDIQFPTGSSFQTNLQLPRTLPKGQDYYLSLWGEPTVQGASYYHYAGLIRIDNLAPVAAASASPPTVAVGAPVTVNASASSDPDGSVVAYRYAWGDGTTLDWTASETAAHTYSSAGNYTVTVSVRDDNGAESSTTLTVHVQAAATNPPPGSPVDLALAIGLGLAVVAVAAVAFFLWRRSRRPPAVAPPPTSAASPPEVPPAGPPGPPPG